MRAFNYLRVSSLEEARAAMKNGGQWLAGGTTLIDLMKLEVETPGALIDIARTPAQIEKQKDGGVKIGAMVKNADLAQDEYIKRTYKVLSEALLSGASAQLRNKATTAGNLLQRTRCVYFRDVSKACNKRKPGSGCPAIAGHNRNLAILGTSEHCIATNPSDMNVALAALQARVELLGGKVIDIADFHLLPGRTPERETALGAGDLISAVWLPPLAKGARTSYLKLRDRQSYEFAVASAAVVREGKRVRFAMGGIATKPWRVPNAEKILEGGGKVSEAVAEFLKGAKAQSENGFKIEVAKRCLTYALERTV